MLKRRLSKSERKQKRARAKARRKLAASWTAYNRLAAQRRRHLQAARRRAVLTSERKAARRLKRPLRSAGDLIASMVDAALGKRESK